MTKPTILIIDDDPDMCDQLKEILEDEKYCVNCTFDGLSGINLINNNNYNAILLDLKIPKLTGFEVLISAKKIRPRSKIIIISGRPLFIDDKTDNWIFPGENKNDINALKLADAIMSKPIDISSLLEKIKKFTSNNNEVKKEIN